MRSRAYREITLVKCEPNIKTMIIFGKTRCQYHQLSQQELWEFICIILNVSFRINRFSELFNNLVVLYFYVPLNHCDLDIWLLFQCTKKESESTSDILRVSLVLFQEV